MTEEQYKTGILKHQKGMLASELIKELRDSILAVGDQVVDLCIEVNPNTYTKYENGNIYFNNDVLAVTYNHHGISINHAD